MESLKKNLIYNIIYQILIIILPLITAPYIARVLGAEKVGIYSYTYSIAYYFSIFSMLGISNHGNRMIASTKKDKNKMSIIFWSIYAIQFVLFIISITAYIMYLLFFVKNNRLVFAIQTIYIISGMFDISWLFFGLEKFKITVTRNIIIKIFTVLAIFLFVKNENDLTKYTLIMVLGTLFSQIYLWRYVKKEVYSIKIDKDVIIQNIKPILILFIPVLSFSIYKVMDKIMLGNMSNYTQVGYYNNAEKIINIPMGIITALGAVMLPRMSSLIAEGENRKSENYIIMSIKLVTILASAISFGLMGISSIFTPIFFGNGFSACTPIIILLSVTVFFISWANVVRTQFLIPNHYDKVYIYSTILGAIINLILNLIFIPKYQAVGAAIGTVAAEFTLMFVQVFSIRKIVNIFEIIFQYSLFIIWGIVMMFVVQGIGRIMGESTKTLIVQILSGSIIYCLGALILLKFKNDELFKNVSDIIYKVLRIKI